MYVRKCFSRALFALWLSPTVFLSWWPPSRFRGCNAPPAVASSSMCPKFYMKEAQQQANTKYMWKEPARWPTRQANNHLDRSIRTLARDLSESGVVYAMYRISISLSDQVWMKFGTKNAHPVKKKRTDEEPCSVLCTIYSLHSQQAEFRTVPFYHRTVVAVITTTRWKMLLFVLSAATMATTTRGHNIINREQYSRVCFALWPCGHIAAFGCVLEFT